MLVASVVGDTTLPVAPYDMKWDGGEAADRVFTHFTTGEGDNAQVDVANVSKAFLWRDEAHPADQKSGYGLPFADIVDGELKIVPSGVQATAAGHGIGQLQGASSAEVAEIKSKIQALYKQVKTVHPDAPVDPFDDNTRS